VWNFTSTGPDKCGTLVTSARIVVLLVKIGLLRVVVVIVVVVKGTEVVEPLAEVDVDLEILVDVDTLLVDVVEGAMVGASVVAAFVVAGVGAGFGAGLRVGVDAGFGAFVAPKHPSTTPSSTLIIINSKESWRVMAQTTA